LDTDAGLKGKRFFFEKKKQKTLVNLGLSGSTGMA
jgi:hypothetical protein